MIGSAIRYGEDARDVGRQADLSVRWSDTDTAGNKCIPRCDISELGKLPGHGGVVGGIHYVADIKCREACAANVSEDGQRGRGARTSSRNNLGQADLDRGSSLNSLEKLCAGKTRNAGQIRDLYISHQIGPVSGTVVLL